MKCSEIAIWHIELEVWDRFRIEYTMHTSGLARDTQTGSQARPSYGYLPAAHFTVT